MSSFTKVLILPAEIEYCWEIARKRNTEAINLGLKTTVQGDELGEVQNVYHYYGCIGEYAVRKLHNLPLKLDVNTFKDKPDIIIDDKPWEIKTTKITSMSLALKTKEFKDNGDDYMIVIVNHYSMYNNKNKPIEAFIAGTISNSKAEHYFYAIGEPKKDSKNCRIVDLETIMDNKALEPYEIPAITTTTSSHKQQLKALRFKLCS